MGRGRNSTTAAALGRLPSGLGLFALGIILAGCAPERASNNDPLLGGVPLPRNGPAAAPPATVAIAAPKPLVGPPPLSPSSAALSPAALAAVGASPDASPLRIGPPPPIAGPPPPSVLTSAPREGGDPWGSAAPSVGARLKGPETLSDSAPRPFAVIAPPTPGGGGAAGFSSPSASRDSYADLQDKLAQRKVLFQALEGPDEQGAWRFSCGVPSREQAGAIHRIELSAAGDRGLTAMREGIDQIDRYQK
jgi:hypothetical protein